MIRAGLLALVASLIVISTGSVVGVSRADEGQEAPPAIMPEAMVGQIQAGYEDYLDAKEAREAELESSVNAELREQTRHAYEDLTAAELENLITSTFADVFEDLSGDPGRFLSDATILNVAEPDAATVRNEGDSMLFEAGVPIRAETVDGELSKIDLSLVMSEGDWIPENPLVDLRVGSSADEGLVLGDEEIGVTQVDAEGVGATRLGDKNLLFSDVSGGNHTDLLVSPTSRGVELFDVLRSVDSPETLRFRFDLPEGSELRSMEGGGAAVHDAEGEISLLIPAPWAKDAQGSTVPVEMVAEGSQLILSVNHHEGDFAYPILVDPTIYQDWGWWFEQQHLTGRGYFTQQLSAGNWWTQLGNKNGNWPTWDGLAVATVEGNHGSGTGGYAIVAPNTGSYISAATINPFYRNNGNGNCPPSSYPHPYDYVGLWNGSSWNMQYETAQSVGASYITGQATQLSFGLGTAGGYIPCWRHVMAGGVGIWLDDFQNPTLGYVGPTPEGWAKKDGTARTFSVSAGDTGLGVQNVRMFGVGTQEWTLHKDPCPGTYENRCPNSDSGPITFTTNGFPYEGRYNGQGAERKFTVQVLDPTGKTAQIERPIWLDGTAPSVSLSGQLAAITDQGGSTEKQQNGPSDKDELSLPTYNLQIAADDGADRSGVQQIKVYLDKDPSKEPGAVPVSTKSAGSCPTAGCARTLTMDYTLRLPGLAAGKHSLFIVAVDKVGNASPLERNIEFEYIPATGMKDEYVMQHFRLPDGNDYSGEAEYHGPEIAVNVINGNVVFHQRDVDVSTDRAGIELERVYNSQQPTKQDTQWGRGWEISQAPAFQPEPEQTPAQTATMQRRGAITNAVTVPQATGQETFSSRLRATVKKTAGGYEVEPVEDEEVTVFDSSGRIQEVVLGDDTPVYLEPRTREGLDLIGSEVPTYASSFGTSGTGAGQFAHPGDVAIDPKGNLWVADMNNNRIQKFNSNGEFLMQFGSYGTANGQLKRPAGVAIDPKGNVWVADANNNRIQKFTETGEYLAKIGNWGAGNGQFKGPEGIDVDSKGNVWVADTANGRIQVLNENAGFVKTISSQGSEPGQLGEPSRIDIGPGGKVWVTDWQNSRVVVFSEAGQFLRQFGSYGSADGQFKHADGLAVDGLGNVWVSDEYNHRVQRFNEDGEYLTQFGVKGSEDGQFKFSSPVGIALDPRGGLWVTDADNNRVERWKSAGILPMPDEKVLAPYFDPPVIDYQYESGKLQAMQLEDDATQGADPELDLNLTGDQVTEVDSEEGGSTDYEYESTKLKAADGPEGETKYAYDSSERLTSVTLANGTIATITYDETSRATSVKVDPAGPEVAKTTNFFYQAEPRRTKVWGGGNPEITYDIGEDGSVLKWAWAETPPTIASISGSLWSKKGQEIENKDHTLFVTGSSPHQVASIRVVANGNAVVAEKTCEDPAVPPSHVCDQPAPLEWITNAAEHAAGRMDLEVIVTDFLGHQSAERFYVVVPQQPPEDPAAPERPSFKSIKLFREENGLDRTKALTESQQNELILELLYDWERRDETAMRAVEEFGSPMHQPELSEMEYRRSYLAQAAEAIPQWGEEHALSTYGGYYVDNRQGGIIYVGFTANQSSQVASLKQSGVLMEPEQVAEMPSPPIHALVNVEALEESVAAFINGNTSASNATTGIAVSPGSATIEVTATDPALVEGLLDAQFGSGAPIDVKPLQYAPSPLSGGGQGRFHSTGPVHAGDWLRTQGQCDSGRSCYAACTANFGARAQVGLIAGDPVFNYFKLTAGHCFGLLTRVKRQPSKAPATNAQLASVGQVERSGWTHVDAAGNFTDAEAIGVNAPLTSSDIFYGDPYHLISVMGMERARLHTEYCWSGVNGRARECGVAYERKRDTLDGHRVIGMWALGASVSGDSGGPVWNPVTKKAVGILTMHNRTSKKPCTYLDSANTKKWCPRTFFTPLLPFHGKPYPNGAMAALGTEFIVGNN